MELVVTLAVILCKLGETNQTIVGISIKVYPVSLGLNVSLLSAASTVTPQPMGSIVVSNYRKRKGIKPTKDNLDLVNLVKQMEATIQLLLLLQL